MSAASNAVPAVDADTPSPAAARSRRGKETIRYTLDLSKAQHRFLKVYALDNDVEASKIVRAVLSLLEEDEDLQLRVESALHGDPDAPAELADADA